MTVSRLAAVALIYAGTAVGWFVLGGTVVHRTRESDTRLANEVAQLWGGRHNQLAPEAWYEQTRPVTETVKESDAHGRAVTRQVTRTVTDSVPVPLISSRVTVGVGLEHRQKGLLWYPTYVLAFQARYGLRNPETTRRRVFVRYLFPSPEAIYDAFLFRVSGQEAAPVEDLAKGVVRSVDLPAGAEAEVEVSYRSRGLRYWSYSFASSKIAQVRDFALDLTTDFDGLDFPAGTISPTAKAREGTGWRLGWRFESLVTGQAVGIEAPNRQNPGPLAARITFFAPVSLLFFLTVMVILGVRRGFSLHPMNYFFVSAAFFAFHLLLAYLVDHVGIHLAFGLAAATSVALVVSYLRLVGGLRLALGQAGLAQVVFLVLFSYAFFFEGYTGITVTVGAVLTLFVLMQLTGRVDWGAAFAPRSARPGEG